ncbi:vesicle formation at the endoplasmic reticulum [Ascosphaera aggregata]|nr:vesicle formation at the endoplasmic reticulum [Ascosphaera aggregata]
MKNLGSLRGDSTRTKAIIHACQGFVVFIAWAMTIAVFTRDGSTDGRTAYYFALCWFTYPALIYLACFPVWPRTMRFANPYAFVTLDLLFALLWFIAWLCIATYVGTGKSRGKSNQEDTKQSGCDAFAYGSPGKCKLSTGTVILGVIVFLMFIATSYFSIHTMMEYRRTGAAPFNQYDSTFAEQSNDAFNSNLNPAHEFDEEESHVPGDTTLDASHMGGYSSLGTRIEENYAPLQQSTEASDMQHRPVPYDPSIYSRASPSPRPPSGEPAVPHGMTMPTAMAGIADQPAKRAPLQLTEEVDHVAELKTLMISSRGCPSDLRTSHVLCGGIFMKRTCYYETPQWSPNNELGFRSRNRIEERGTSSFANRELAYVIRAVNCSGTLLTTMSGCNITNLSTLAGPCPKRTAAYRRIAVSTFREERRDDASDLVNHVLIRARYHAMTDHGAVAGDDHLSRKYIEKGPVSAPTSSALTTVSQLKSVPKGWKKNPQAPSPDVVLRLHLSLASENPEALEKKLLSISTPGTEDYGKHLTQDELQELLQPSAESTAAVESWLKSGGVSPSSIERNGNNLVFNITVSDAEKLLNTAFHSYTSDSRAHAIRTLEYSVPASIAPHVRMVQPTTRFGIRKATNVMKAESSSQVRAIFKRFEVNGFDCDQEITPDCLRRLYNMENFTSIPNPKNKLFISGYLNEFAVQKDFTTFLNKYAKEYADNRFSFIGVSNATNPQNDTPYDSLEASLDVDYAIGLSNADATYIGTAGDGPLIPDNDAPEQTGNVTEPYLDQIDYLLSLSDEELPSVLSTSYGENEQQIPRDYADAVCLGFAKLGARGVSVIFSSGDEGVGQACMSNDGKNQTRFNPIFPATCPYVTSVGATHQVEPERATSFSSGGFSEHWPQPEYQKAAVETYLLYHLAPGTWDGLYNPSGRGFPDVAAQGWNFHIINKGKDVKTGGTSASAPTFAAVIYNLNSIRLSVGKPTLGFLNPFLYGVAQKSLNDITHGGSEGCTGTDSRSKLKTPYVPGASWNATLGWDPVTGLGTPDFEKLAKLVLDI